MTAQYFISLRGNKTGQSKAKRLNKTRAAETSFFGSLFESLVFLWVFFPLEKIKRATDLLSFTGGKCVLPAVFNPLSFCQCFLHNLECPLIPCLIALSLFIFQTLAVQVPAFLWSLPSPSGTLFIYFENTSVCSAFTEVVPYVSVCLARLHGQCLIFLVSVSCMLSPLPLIAFSNIDWREPNRISPGTVWFLCVLWLIYARV